MLGLLPKILLDLVEERAGPQPVSEVKRRSGVPEEKRYRLDTVYADEEWQLLLSAACEVLHLSQDELEIVYADRFGRDAVRRWPVWFQMSKNARQLLERQQTIHNTFATGVRDPAERKGIEDKFRIDMLDSELVTHYRSPNRLCGFYKALARWVLNHYHDDASIDETRCLKRGDSECQIHIRWEATGREQ
jgi:hypothetical protein